MSIIAVATTKGGSGKTTLTMALADWWRRAGVSVEAIDTDPNRNLTTWVGLVGRPFPCTPVPEDEVVEAALQAADRADMVLVDVAGALARAMTHAFSVASAVLIPVKTAQLEVLEAARTRAVLNSSVMALRHRIPDADIPYAAVLTQVDRRTRVAEATREQLGQLGVPALRTDIPRRTAYQAATFHGLLLDDRQVMDDVAAVAAEVSALLEAGRG